MSSRVSRLVESRLRYASATGVDTGFAGLEAFAKVRGDEKCHTWPPFYTYPQTLHVHCIRCNLPEQFAFTNDTSLFFAMIPKPLPVFVQVLWPQSFARVTLWPQMVRIGLARGLWRFACCRAGSLAQAALDLQ